MGKLHYKIARDATCAWQCRCLFLVSCIFSIFATNSFIVTANAQGPDQPKAHQVKAAYLYNFTRYVQWPESSSASSPFVIAVVGDDPIGETLNTVATTKKANGRTIVIKRYHSIEEVESCSMLYLTASASNTLGKQAISATEGKPVLLVADAGDMAAAGAPISFYLDVDGTVGFSINIDAAQRRGLRMDAKLLKLASVVRDAEQ